MFFPSSSLEKMEVLPFSSTSEVEDQFSPPTSLLAVPHFRGDNAWVGVPAPQPAGKSWPQLPFLQDQGSQASQEKALIWMSQNGCLGRGVAGYAEPSKKAVGRRPRKQPYLPTTCNRNSCTFGTRVAPPTRITWSISS